jgi:LysM repeat protein
VLHVGQYVAVGVQRYRYGRVQPGDTLSQIGERFGTTVEATAQANGIENLNIIYAGQVLYIPPSFVT